MVVLDYVLWSATLDLILDLTSKFPLRLTSNLSINFPQPCIDGFIDRSTLVLTSKVKSKVETNGRMSEQPYRGKKRPYEKNSQGKAPQIFLVTVVGGSGIKSCFSQLACGQATKPLQKFRFREILGRFFGVLRRHPRDSLRGEIAEGTRVGCKVRRVRLAIFSPCTVRFLNSVRSVS